MTSAQAFLQEIHAFSQAQGINDPVGFTHYFKYHLHCREEGHYYDTIVRALEEADKPQYVEIVSFVAYIQEIDPESDKWLHQSKENVLQRAIKNAYGVYDPKNTEILLTEMGKLVSPQRYCELMHKISRLSDNQGSEPKQILNLLLVLQKKVSWQIWKKRHFVADNERQAFKIINEVVQNIRELAYIDRSSIIEGKMKLIKIILQFFGAFLQATSSKIAPILDKITIIRPIILQQVELFFRSNKNYTKLRFQLIDQSIQVFGIFNSTYLSQIFSQSTNKYNLSEQKVLNLITTVLSTSEKNRVINKEIATKLLNDISQKVLEVKKGSIVQNYRTISKMCDVMIELSKQYVIDLTKNIVRQLQSFNTKACQQLFLSALLLLFDIKMPQKMTSHLDEQSKKLYTGNKYQERYYNFLKQFGRLDFKVDQVGFDPEKCDEVIPWHLLALRLSILLNYEWLHQINLLSGILTNLIRYMLNNIYSQQCADIALVIISQAKRNKEIRIHTDQYDKYWIRNVDIINIVSQIIHSSDRKQLPDNRSLSLLYKVLLSLKQNDELMSSRGLSLFLNVTHLIGIIITQNGRRDQKSLDISIKLMRASLPFSADGICKKELQKCLQMLDYLIKINLQNNFIDIFMELIYICLKRTEITDIILSNDPFQSIKEKSCAIGNKYQQHRFQILSFMGHRNKLQRQQILSDCWRTFSQALHRSQHELCLLLGKIFSYFFNNMAANYSDINKYRLFLKEQIIDATSFCKQIVIKVNKTTLIPEIICLFQTLQVCQTYLLDLVAAFHKIAPSAELNSLKIVEQYSNDVIESFCEQKWMLIVQQHAHQTALKKVFVANYFLQLMLFASSSNSHLPRPGSYQRQSKIVKKFAWIQNIISDDKLLPRQMKRILMNAVLSPIEPQSLSNQ